MKAFRQWNSGWNARMRDVEASWEITEPAIYHQAGHILVLILLCP